MLEGTEPEARRSEKPAGRDNGWKRGAVATVVWRTWEKTMSRPEGAFVPPGDDFQGRLGVCVLRIPKIIKRTTYFDKRHEK